MVFKTLSDCFDCEIIFNRCYQEHSFMFEIILCGPKSLNGF